MGASSPISHGSRESLFREASVHDDLGAVDFDHAALAEVHDHVPVQAGLVVVAAFGISGTQGGVAGAADLFVKEGVAGVALYVVVGADGALTEEAASRIHVEHGY